MPESVTCDLGTITAEEWGACSHIIGMAIPNAVISRMGRSFGARFYSAIGQQDYSCAFVARDRAKRILGIIVGSLDKPRAYRQAVRGQRFRLALSAGLRLVAPSVLLWVLRGLLERLCRRQNATDRPPAELIAIAVERKFRGTGVAMRLVETMEGFFRDAGYSGEYAILTEATNERANRFYEKIGGRCVKQLLHHRRRMNEWRKSLRC